MNLPPLVAISTQESYLQRLPHPLTREEEQEVARAMVENERVLVEALLETRAGSAELAAVASELRGGTLCLADVVRNVEHDRARIPIQRAAVIRAARSAAGAADSAARRKTLAARLVHLRVHLRVFARMESAARGRAIAADLPALERARRARVEIERLKKTLVERNLRLVVTYAKRYRNRGLALLDLVQEGNLGLMHAVEKFDHRKGHRLNTYATWWIKQYIQRAIVDTAPTIRVPVHLVESKTKVLRSQRAFYADRGSEATPEEISEHTGVPTPRVDAILRLPREPLSLEAPLGDDSGRSLSEVVADRAGQAPEAEAASRQMAERAHGLLHTLNERDRLVLTLRFGLDGTPGRTLEDVGEALSLTRERIRQIEAEALKKLRARCAKLGYRPELER